MPNLHSVGSLSAHSTVVLKKCRVNILLYRMSEKYSLSFQRLKNVSSLVAACFLCQPDAVSRTVVISLSLEKAYLKLGMPCCKGSFIFLHSVVVFVLACLIVIPKTAHNDIINMAQ